MLFSGLVEEAEKEKLAQPRFAKIKKPFQTPITEHQSKEPSLAEAPVR